MTLSCIRRVITGERSHHKKWKIKSRDSVNAGIKKEYIFVDPQGNMYESSMSDFCRKHDLIRPDMIKVAKGQREHHKGWKCHYKF